MTSGASQARTVLMVSSRALLRRKSSSYAIAASDK